MTLPGVGKGGAVIIGIGGGGGAAAWSPVWGQPPAVGPPPPGAPRAVGSRGGAAGPPTAGAVVGCDGAAAVVLGGLAGVVISGPGLWAPGDGGSGVVVLLSTASMGGPTGVGGAVIGTPVGTPSVGIIVVLVVSWPFPVHVNLTCAVGPCPCAPGWATGSGGWPFPLLGSLWGVDGTPGVGGGGGAAAVAPGGPAGLIL